MENRNCFSFGSYAADSLYLLLTDPLPILQNYRKKR